MQSRVGSIDASVEIVEKADTGIDFAATKRAKQETKQAAAGEFMRAKVAEAKKKKNQLDPVKPLVSQEILPRYDPCAICTNWEVKFLSDYMKNQPGFPKRQANTSLQWYHDFRTPRVWLHDTQIDAAIDLLRLRQHHHQEWFRSERLCFIETLLGTLWKRHYSEFLEALAKPDQQPTDIPMPPGAWDFHTGQLPLFMQSKKA